MEKVGGKYAPNMLPTSQINVHILTLMPVHMLSYMQVGVRVVDGIKITNQPILKQGEHPRLSRGPPCICECPSKWKREAEEGVKVMQDED